MSTSTTTLLIRRLLGFLHIALAIVVSLELGGTSLSRQYMIKHSFFLHASVKS
jgi:hypothetical protein